MCFITRGSLSVSLDCRPKLLENKNVVFFKGEISMEAHFFVIHSNKRCCIIVGSNVFGALVMGYIPYYSHIWYFILNWCLYLLTQALLLYFGLNPLPCCLVYLLIVDLNTHASLLARHLHWDLKAFISLRGQTSNSAGCHLWYFSWTLKHRLK